MIVQGAADRLGGALFISAVEVLFAPQCEMVFVARHFSVAGVYISRTHPRQAPERSPREDVMRLHQHSLKSLIGKIALAAVAFGGFLVYAGAPAAQAQEFGRPAFRSDNFREREAIEHHGFYSPQAAHWGNEGREVFAHGWGDRNGCWHRH